MTATTSHAFAPTAYFQNPFSQDKIREYPSIPCSNPILTQEQKEALERGLESCFQWIPETANLHTFRPDIYSGSAGIAFMFWRMSFLKNEFLEGTTYEDKALEWIKHTLSLIQEKEYIHESSASRKYISRVKYQHQYGLHGCGFICSIYGIYALASVIYQKRDPERAQLYLDSFMKFEDNLENDYSPELLYGLSGKQETKTMEYFHTYMSPRFIPVETVLAHITKSNVPLFHFDSLLPPSFKNMLGYLYAILFLENYSNFPSSIRVRLHQLKVGIIDSLFQSLETVESITSRHTSFWSWHGKYYLGAAHGQVGILYQLLNCRDILSSGQQRAVFHMVDELILYELRDGNYPSSLNSGKHTHLVQWCHGAPGLSLLFIKAFEITGDYKYFNRAAHCLDVIWSKGLLRKGPGLCHGLSGNAYPFLHMFEVENDQCFWEAAVQFGCFASNFNRFIADGEMSQADHMASLFEGVCGLVLYINELLAMDYVSETGSNQISFFGFPCFADI